MLTCRRADILKLVIGAYIDYGVPIGSETVARMGLNASSATIRNEMSGLEEEGYLLQPHTSAGRIPSNKGYRWYINEIINEVQLPAPEQRMISHQFHQVEREVDECTRLAAATLSRMLNNVAIVTSPKAVESVLQHIELVLLGESNILVIIVLKGSKIIHQVIALDEPVSQKELDICTRNLKSNYIGLSYSRIASADDAVHSSLEKRILKTIIQIMKVEGEEEYGEPHIDGLRHILDHPELISSSRTRGLFEMFEQKSMLRSLLPRVVTGDKIQVIIGGENKEETLRDCSIIITRYGIPGEINGAVGVIGPTRMNYIIAIPAVNFLSRLMSELVL